ncbi:MAG: ATPase, T2SS/T4P/T4SS family [Oscillospiraceae bacterium]
MNFDNVLNALPPHIKSLLKSIPDDTKEITLRVRRPLCVSLGTTYLYVSNLGNIKTSLEDCYIVSKDDISDTLKIATEYSIHSYKEQINSGFITIKGGHRIGICGTAFYKDEKIQNISDISTLNIRIARQQKGVATEILHRVKGSILIVGAPSSGKTTLLRDIARQLGSKEKISLIDERGELACCYNGIPQNDVGALTDILDGYKKSDGMQIALRTLSPKTIILDEIGNSSDCSSIEESVNSGVKIIATAHASSKDELLKRKNIKELIELAFDYIVFLQDANSPCTIKNIFSKKEFLL